MAENKFQAAAQKKAEAEAGTQSAFDAAAKPAVQSALMKQLGTQDLAEGQMLVMAAYPVISLGADGKSEVKVVTGSFTMPAKNGIVSDSVVVTDLGPHIQTQWANCGVLALSALGKLNLTGIRVHAHPELEGTKGKKQGFGASLVKATIQ